MSRCIDSITLEELFNKSTDGSFPVLVDITHNDIMWRDDDQGQEDGHLRLINANYPVLYQGDNDTGRKKYLPSHFVFTPPSEDGKSVSGASVTISAIDRRIVEVIRMIENKPRMRVEAFFERTEDDKIVFRRLYHYEFELSSVTWDGVSAKWELTFDPTMSLNVPRDLATINRCPSINTEN